MKTLRVTSVSDVKTNKNGHEYKTVKLEQPNIHQIMDPMGSGQLIFVKGKPQQVTINPNKNSYLEQDEKGNPIGSAEYGWDFKVGDFIQGAAVRRLVQPYQIGENMVNVATVAVFADTDDPEAFEIEVQRAFRANGKTLINAVQTTNTVVEAEEEFE